MFRFMLSKHFKTKVILNSFKEETLGKIMLKDWFFGVHGHISVSGHARTHTNRTITRPEMIAYWILRLFDELHFLDDLRHNLCRMNFAESEATFVDLFNFFWRFCDWTKLCNRPIWMIYLRESIILKLASRGLCSNAVNMN